MIVLERDANGWNLARLVKKAAERGRARRPRLAVVAAVHPVADASVSIRDKVGSTYTLPKQISDLDLKARYEYAPVHYTVTSSII